MRSSSGRRRSLGLVRRGKRAEPHPLRRALTRPPGSRRGRSFDGKYAISPASASTVQPRGVSATPARSTASAPGAAEAPQRLDLLRTPATVFRAVVLDDLRRNIATCHGDVVRAGSIAGSEPERAGAIPPGVALRRKSRWTSPDGGRSDGGADPGSRPAAVPITRLASPSGFRRLFLVAPFSRSGRGVGETLRAAYPGFVDGSTATVGDDVGSRPSTTARAKEYSESALPVPDLECDMPADLIRGKEGHRRRRTSTPVADATAPLHVHGDRRKGERWRNSSPCPGCRDGTVRFSLCAARRKRLAAVSSASWRPAARLEEIPCPLRRHLHNCVAGTNCPAPRLGHRHRRGDRQPDHWY